MFNGQVVDFVLNFVIDSFKNTIAAFMWPVDIVTAWQPYGAIALGLAFWLFPIFVKPHVEKWMFGGEPPAADTKQD